MTESNQISPESENDYLLIERAKPEDAEAVVEVLRLTWMDTYPNAEVGITDEDIRLRTEGEHGERIGQNINKWRKNIENIDGSRLVIVARINGKVVGVTAPRVTDGIRRLGALYVLPEAQGKGVGGLLIRKALEWHGNKDDIYLNVATYNLHAIDFYRNYGFEQTDNPVVDEGNVYGKTQIPEIEMVRKAKNTQL
jgi:ribosomal protein S18 acetylase RimI-like enzyme